MSGPVDWNKMYMHGVVNRGEMRFLEKKHKSISKALYKSQDICALA
jgi:hypothetical protein